MQEPAVPAPSLRHAVGLLARTDTPRTPAQVAVVVGLSAVTVRQVLHRWNADGPAGLAVSLATLWRALARLGLTLK